MKKLSATASICCLLSLTACAEIMGPDPQEARITAYCAKEAHPLACISRIHYLSDQYRNVTINPSVNPQLWAIPARLP